MYQEIIKTYNFYNILLLEEEIEGSTYQQKNENIKKFQKSISQGIFTENVAELINKYYSITNQNKKITKDYSSDIIEEIIGKYTDNITIKTTSKELIENYEFIYLKTLYKKQFNIEFDVGNFTNIKIGNSRLDQIKFLRKFTENYIKFKENPDLVEVLNKSGKTVEEIIYEFDEILKEKIRPYMIFIKIN